MRHAVSMTGCIDRTHERHRAIQLVKVLAGVRAIMGCHPVGHGEPGALRRDRSNVRGMDDGSLLPFTFREPSVSEASTEKVSA
jgi:hypothetical protein